MYHFLLKLRGVAVILLLIFIKLGIPLPSFAQDYSLATNLVSYQAKSYAQTKTLVKVLEEVSVKFNVNIFYEEDHLKQKRVSASVPSQGKVEKILTDILLPLGLESKKIGDRMYLIELPKTIEKNSTPKEVEKSETIHYLEQKSIDLGDNALTINTPKKELLQSIDRTINGKIVSANGEPLPGANIIVKGTSIGTISDAQGVYYLAKVPDDAKYIIISLIGYLSQEIEIGNRMVVDVVMSEDIRQMQEVLVIGYGTTTKSDITGSVGSLKGKDLNSSIVTGVDQALAGRVAGVSTVLTSGQPGGGVAVRVRGTSSINGNSEPLYVIDGLPISGNSGSVYDLNLGAVGGDGKTTYGALSGLNPNDIESVEVLKDASATAIYGNRASNGVVIITTKRGKANEAKFNYDFYTGVQEIAKYLPLMNLREYAAYQNDLAAETDGSIPREEFADPSLLGEGSDWQKAIFRKAPIQSHQLTVSQGNDKTQFVLSAGYMKQDGIAVGSNFKRYSIRFNLDTQVKKWLKLGNSLTVSYTDERLNLYDQTGGIIQTALKSTPDVPVYNFDGTYATATGQGARINPLAIALDQLNSLKRTQMLGNLYADVNLLKGLTFRTEFGGNVSFANALSFRPTYNYGPNVKNDVNSISDSRNQNTFWQFKNYFTYTRNFLVKHNVTAMIGQEASEWGFRNLSGSATGLPVNNVTSIGLADVKSMTVNGALPNTGALLSYYGRLNYNFDNKYYFTFTYRADGSSNFGPGNRWGYFPAMAVSWRLSGENFMKSIENVVSDMKLRASWGLTGNQNIPSYAWGTKLAVMQTGLGAGYRSTNVPNPNVSWETAQQVDLGLDLALFSNKIEITFDYYNKIIKNLLMQQQLAAYAGSRGNAAIVLQSPWINIPEKAIKNQGFELTITSHNLKKGGLSWDTDFNISHNRNSLLSLGTEGSTLDGYAQWFTLVARSRTGFPLGEFYGYKVVGVFKDKEDILNSPRQYPLDANGNPATLNRNTTVWVGDLKFADINNDGVIDENDRTYLGSPQPKFTFGLNNSFQYKNFELSIFLSGSYGNKILNFVRMGDGNGGLDGMRSQFDNQLRSVVDRAKTKPIGEAVGEWYNDIDNVTLANPGTTIPRAHWNDPNRNTRMSDRYIEDGSYLRIRNISLAYNLPQTIARRIYLNNLKVYANIQNLYTFTKYSGYDPEVGQGTLGAFTFGTDNGRYPSPRMYTIGLNVGF
jgi:TonB-linked SusC/RagA family outer membrane protein